MATQATTPDLTRTSAPLTMLVPGDNPRRKKPEQAYVDEMAQTMRSLGVIEPLVVRWHPKQPEKLQIIAGETRFTAAQLAGLSDVPVVVKDWDDDKVLEAQLVENIQRSAMHPIDEGEAFKRLTDRKVNPYTVEQLAKKVGKSVRWVYNRLEFTKLIPPLREAFLADEITVSHAELLARLEPTDQERINNEDDYTDGLWHVDFLDFDGDDNAESKRRVRSVRDVNDWIEKNVRLAIGTDAVQRLIPEVEDVQIEAQAQHARVLQVATTRDLPKHPEIKDRFKGVLTEKHWQRAGGRSACAFAEKAVIVFGQGQGDILDVCVNKKQCAQHWPDHTPEAKARAQQSGAKGDTARDPYAQELAERVARDARWQRLLPALRTAGDVFIKALKTPTSAQLRAALEYFDVPNAKPADLARALVRRAIERRLAESYSQYDEKGLVAFLVSMGLDVKAVTKSIEKPAPEKTADASPAKAKKAPKPIDWNTHFAKDDKPKKKTAKAPAKRKAGKKR